MEIQTLDIQPSLTEMKMLINSSLLTFNLPELINTMKHSSDWIRGELNAMILLNGPEKQIILTALHEDTEIDSYQSKDSITIQVIEGKMQFQSKKESITLNQGQLLTLHDNIKYKLISTEDTVFLLTVTNRIVKHENN